MLVYVAKRTLQSLVILVIMISAVFFAGRMIGDPALMILGPEASQEDRESLRRALGLEQPIPVQYGRFIQGAATGDFGDTFRYGRRTSRMHGPDASGFFEETGANPALPLVLERLPATFLLAAVALGFAFAIALLLGIIAAMRPRSQMDRSINVLSLGGVSIVDFWLGFMLIFFFSVRLGWLPTSGAGTWQHVLLPAATLAVRPIGRLTQLVRSSMLDELAKPYVEAARAKGVSERAIVYVHALKNSAIPIVTMMGDETANILTGVIIVEVVFAWPGIGQLLIQALLMRDLPLIEATIFVLIVMVIAVNWLVDLSYTYLDPKVRLAN